MTCVTFTRILKNTLLRAEIKMGINANCIGLIAGAVPSQAADKDSSSHVGTLCDWTKRANLTIQNRRSPPPNALRELDSPGRLWLGLLLAGACSSTFMKGLFPAACSSPCSGREGGASPRPLERWLVPPPLLEAPLVAEPSPSAAQSGTLASAPELAAHPGTDRSAAGLLWLAATKELRVAPDRPPSAFAAPPLELTLPANGLSTPELSAGEGVVCEEVCTGGPPNTPPAKRLFPPDGFGFASFSSGACSAAVVEGSVDAALDAVVELPVATLRELSLSAAEVAPESVTELPPSPVSPRPGAPNASSRSSAPPGRDRAAAEPVSTGDGPELHPAGVPAPWVAPPPPQSPPAKALFPFLASDPDPDVVLDLPRAPVRDVSSCAVDVAPKDEKELAPSAVSSRLRVAFPPPAPAPPGRDRAVAEEFARGDVLGLREDPPNRFDLSISSLSGGFRTFPTAATTTPALTARVGLSEDAPATRLLPLLPSPRANADFGEDEGCCCGCSRDDCPSGSGDCGFSLAVRDPRRKTLGRDTDTPFMADTIPPPPPCPGGSMDFSEPSPASPKVVAGLPLLRPFTLRPLLILVAPSFVAALAAENALDTWSKALEDDRLAVPSGGATCARDSGLASSGTAAGGSNAAV